MEKRKCFFCKKVKKTFEVGIALGSGGDDYSFCFDCLKGMTALKFWKKIFGSRDRAWPPEKAAAPPTGT